MIRRLLCAGMVALALLGGGSAYEVSAADTDNSHGRVTTKVETKNNDFNISLEYGINGYAEYDQGCRLQISVVSSQDFTGKISVMSYYPDSSGYQSMMYSEKITLEKDIEANAVFDMGSLGSGNIILEISDEDGKVVYSEKDLLALSSADSAAVTGVLSDDPDSLDYLDSVKLKYGEEDDVSVITLDMSAEDIPDDSMVMDSLDYLIVDNYDTSLLSQKQYEAIKSWVDDGGSLILCMGTAEKDVMNLFDDGYVTSDTVPQNDNDMSILNKGYGKVITLEYSLGTKASDDSVQRQSMLQDIFSYGLNNAMGNTYAAGYNGNAEYYAMETAVEANNGRRIPVAAILIALVVYILLCGPVTYIGLKKIRRRELIWLVVPVLAVIGTLLIYIVSLKYRVTRPVTSSFAVADISGDTVSQTTYTNVIGPRAKDYDIDVASEYNDIRLSDDGYWTNYGSDDVTARLEKINDKGNISLKFYNPTPFGSVGLKTSSVFDNNIGSIGRNLHLYTDGFDGEITNNTDYDMKNVVIMSDGYYYCIEELKRGETIPVSRDDNMRMIGIGAAYNSLNEYYDKKYDGEHNAPSRLVDRNYYMMYIFNGSVPDNHHYGEIAIWGDVNRPVDVTADGESDNYNVYTVYDIGSYNYEDVRGAYYSNIYMLASGADSQAGYDQEDLMMYSNEVNITIKFQDDDNIETLKYDLEKNVERSKVTVSALNNTTGNYDDIFVDGQTEIKGDELDKYMKDNMIVLKFVVIDQQDHYYDNYLPYIIASGGEQ